MKQRRDAGVSRVPVPASVGPVAASAAPVAASAAPMTEAAFGRKREAAIANAVASSPSKRACVAPDMNWVQQVDDPEMAPAPTCVERLYPVVREVTASQKQRRDAGVPRVAASAAPVAASAASLPLTEAAFGRKREAAITIAVASSPRKRARVAPV